MKKIIILSLVVLFLSAFIAGCIETLEKAPLSTPEIRIAIDNPESFDAKEGHQVRTTTPTTVVIYDEGYIVKKIHEDHL